jgi:NDP-sugar pyrophosphorylase family protein
MKAILICPGYRPAMAPLTEAAPLAAVPLLGESLLVYWLGHLAARGAREVTILACDRPAVIRQIAGTGARWGLHAKVVAEMHELTPAEAKSRHGAGDEDIVVFADHLPGVPDIRLCESHAEWYAGTQAWLDRAVTPDRTGVRELAPGIRVGWASRVPSDTILRGPCWIGEKVRIGRGVTIGPNVVIEDRAVIGDGAELMRSVIGTETYVGGDTEVTDSLAFGDLLINWRSGSCLRVPDEFLLCSLRRPQRDSIEWFRRIAQVLTGSNPPMPAIDHSAIPRLSANPPA